MSLDDRRGTGRTTRMLDAALDAALHGQTVAVVAADELDVGRFQQMLESMAHGSIIQVRNGRLDFPNASISIRAPALTFNWMTLRFQGMDQATMVLVDHYAIEMYWGNMLTMLHRFDSPGEIT